MQAAAHAAKEFLSSSSSSNKSVNMSPGKSGPTTSTSSQRASAGSTDTMRHTASPPNTQSANVASSTPRTVPDASQPPPVPSTENTSSTTNAMTGINEIKSRDKQHDTEVREVFNPAVTREQVRPMEREEETIAVDRELHQDHYQTRVQPVSDRQVMPEEHRHNVMPVQRREKKHGKDEEIKQKLAAEKAQFKDTREVLPVERTKTTAGAVAGEHVHHHVYEQVQPVVEREVVQPSVVHTTVPIHERIEHEPTFHPATVQPKMTMEEYRKAGGSLEGRPEIRDVFEGEPQVREGGGAHQKHPHPHGQQGPAGHHTDHPSAKEYDVQRTGERGHGRRSSSERV